MEEKKETRREIAWRIRALSPADRVARSRAACSLLTEVPEVAAARTILFYAPLPDELNIWPAVYAFAQLRKRIVLPKCIPETRDVLCIEIHNFERDLAPGTFNILEPRSTHSIELAELDAVVSPGRAFDRAGNRVGRGVGYYDRFFARPAFRAFKCGIAFDCQILPEVPVEPHDIPMNALVTESRWFRADRWPRS